MSTTDVNEILIEYKREEKEAREREQILKRDKIYSKPIMIL
jgi:hypothetical protein